MNLGPFRMKCYSKCREDLEDEFLKGEVHVDNVKFTDNILMEQVQVHVYNVKFTELKDEVHVDNVKFTDNILMDHHVTKC